MSLAGSAAPQASGESAQRNPLSNPPTLAAPFEPTPSSSSVATTTTPQIIEGGDGAAGVDDKKKGKKRGIFGFGKKKPDAEPSQALDAAPPRPPAKDRPARKAPTSPIAVADPSMHLPASPGRGRGYGALSSSPRLASPAGSQIFERDVQESSHGGATLPNSPAIPAHITTENHIPPVLDASSEAITADGLDPDSVEIITHTGHQPAAVTVTGVGGGAPGSPYGVDAMSASWAEELASFTTDKDDAASNYGSFDTTDVRRLSFISFADVVQAEQQQQQHVGSSRDSMHLAGLTSVAMVGVNRSPSPIRSPVSSQGPGTSPPTSKSGSVKGLEMSPSRKPMGSPQASGLSGGSAGLPTINGEITIETMSQALRRTGSGDLSGVRSLPTSPIEGPSR